MAVYGEPELRPLARYTMTPEEVQEWMKGMASLVEANPVIPACSEEKVAQMEEANTYPILIQTVQNNIARTMRAGESVHGPGQWMKQSRDFHINRALKHLADFLLLDDLEDLEHALCRLGMAVHQDHRP